MTSNETPEQHAARIADAERTADAMNEASREYVDREKAAIQGAQHGISGGVHHGDITFKF